MRWLICSQNNRIHSEDEFTDLILLVIEYNKFVKRIISQQLYKIFTKVDYHQHLKLNFEYNLLLMSLNQKSKDVKKWRNNFLSLQEVLIQWLKTYIKDDSIFISKELRELPSFINLVNTKLSFWNRKYHFRF